MSQALTTELMIASSRAFHPVFNKIKTAWCNNHASKARFWIYLHMKCSKPNIESKGSTITFEELYNLKEQNK